MAVKDYTQAALFIDNVLAVEVTDFNVSYESGDNDVETMQLGYAGRSQGPRKTMISVNSAIPRSGFEIDYLQRLQDGSAVKMVWYRGAQKVSCEGFIKSVKESFGTTQTSQVSFEFTGTSAVTATLL